MNWCQFFRYDPETGGLFWIVDRRGPTRTIGRLAGTVKHDGRYRTVHVGQKRVYCHRVCWEIVNGPIPDGMCIDHIDGNGLNNRAANLRIVTKSANQRNRRLSKNNRFGIDGLSVVRGGYSVYCAGYVGWTKDFFEACCMRKSAQIRNGYHANHGKALS